MSVIISQWLPNTTFQMGLGPWPGLRLRGLGAVSGRPQTPAGWWAGAMASQCSGVTRKGARCSITSTSRLADERGRLVAEPLQRGGADCRFHARPFVTQCVEHVGGPALLFFLDLEATGVDPASDQIVELACCHAPSDPRASGAACFYGRSRNRGRHGVSGSWD